jgi:hypothetical protein
MQNAKIRVDVKPGVFRSERSVSFTAGTETYAMLVDELDVQGDTLNVRVLGESDDEVWVDLPRETLNTGRYVKLPRSSVIFQP